MEYGMQTETQKALLAAKEKLLAEVWQQGRAGDIAAMIDHVASAARLDALGEILRASHEAAESGTNTEQLFERLWLLRSKVGPECQALLVSRDLVDQLLDLIAENHINVMAFAEKYEGDKVTALVDRAICMNTEAKAEDK